MSTGNSCGVPATSAPAAVRSKPISLRYFLSLFHQLAASASAGQYGGENHPLDRALHLPYPPLIDHRNPALSATRVIVL
jgi:hypothetical protein